MKRIAQSVVVCLALLGVAAVQTHAQAPAGAPTVDQIIDKCIAALGGRPALEKLTSRTGKGTIEIPEASMSGSVEVFEKAPNMSAIAIDLGGMQIRQAFDGKVAWEENPQTGLQEKTGIELAEAKREATFNQELHLKTLFPKMTVRGKEQVGTATAWVVDAVPAEGKPVVFYFDAESGLPLRMDATRDGPDGSPMQVQAYLEDYRAIDGVKVAHTVRQVTPMFSMVMRLVEVKHNVTLDDKMFKKPGGL